MLDNNKSLWIEFAEKAIVVAGLIAYVVCVVTLCNAIAPESEERVFIAGMLGMVALNAIWAVFAAVVILNKRW